MPFDDVVQMALQSDRLSISDNTQKQIKGQTNRRAFMAVSDSFELNSLFRDESGGYIYHFHEWTLRNGNVFDHILAEEKNLTADPLFIGIFDWQNGMLGKDDITPFVRCDMAFAIVYGASLEQDRAALEDLFNNAEFYPVILIS